MSSESQRMTHRLLSLGGANSLELMLQLLLPVVLTRTLAVDAFGHYRLLWLATNTLVTLAPLAMPRSLFFFLPRAEPSTAPLYIRQAFLFLTLGGALGALVLSPANPWPLPQFAALLHYGWHVPVFVLGWLCATLLDQLPAAEQRVRWQASLTLGLALLRALVLVSVAVQTRDVGALLIALIGFTLVKLLLLAAYLGIYHGWRGAWLQPARLREQLAHALPFGAAGALYGMRAQADQWIAAFLFTPARFASFSVAAVVAPLVNVLRQSVTQAYLPRMSQQQAAGDLSAVLSLNSRANCITALVALPILAFLFVYAQIVVSLVYTQSYVEAAGPLRAYLVGLAGLTVEFSSVLFLLGEGRYSLLVNGVTLILSFAISWFGGVYFGLTGAALGSVCAVYCEAGAALGRIARVSGVPLRRLQDWPQLLQLIIAACLAAAAGAVAGMPWRNYQLLALALGGLTTAASYAALLFALRMGPRLLRPLQ